MLHNADRIWLGLTDVAEEGTWVREDIGEVADWFFWDAGSPNNGVGGTEHCAYIHHNTAEGSDQLWGDAQCLRLHYYVCETSY